MCESSGLSRLAWAARPRQKGTPRSSNALGRSPSITPRRRSVGFPASLRARRRPLPRRRSRRISATRGGRRNFLRRARETPSANCAKKLTAVSLHNLCQRKLADIRDSLTPTSDLNQTRTRSANCAPNFFGVVLGEGGPGPRRFRQSGDEISRCRAAGWDLQLVAASCVCGLLSGGGVFVESELLRVTEFSLGCGNCDWGRARVRRSRRAVNEGLWGRAWRIIR